MAGISDYVDLCHAVSDLTGRTDLFPVMDRLVGLAEAKLSRELYTQQQERSATVVLTGGIGTLPQDLLEISDVWLAPGKRVPRVPLDLLEAGAGNRYAIDGRSLIVRPQAASVSVKYLAGIPTIINSAANFLLTDAPDVYLYAVAREVAIWSGDVEKAGLAYGLLKEAVRSYRIGYERLKWGDSRVSLGGVP